MRYVRRWHRHRWEPRATSLAIDWHINTVVLYVCEHCGKAKTKKLRGEWRIADLSTLGDASFDALSKMQKGPVKP